MGEAISIERGAAALDASIAAGSNRPQPTRTDEGTEGESQASKLVAFVEQAAELFHDQNKDVYARERATLEVRRLDGRAFRDWLVAKFYAETGKVTRDQSVREALSTLAGRGRLNGKCRDVHVRVGALDGAYFLDLGETGQNRIVKIAPGGWEIVSDAPVMFIRPESMRPLPEPISGGDISLLWRIANIPKESRLLVIAWLCECLRPDTPFPVLELIGEHGSAKSETQRALRRLIDPNGCDLRSAPKSVEDIFVGAGMNWLASYENVSHLPAPMQDALCVLATGGGFATRKFYTNTDESVITVKRPVVLNGISVAVTAQDLVDRTVSIEMPIICERVETTELRGWFEENHARLLGALLDVMAAALAKLPNIEIAPLDRPRLIEFARLGMAVAEAMGHAGSEFLGEFKASRQESIARTIDASPVATAVIEWFNACGRRPEELPLKELMRLVEGYKPPGGDAWPRTPKGFGDALRRAAPALRQIGIECRSAGKVGGSFRWKIADAGKRSDQCPASPESPHIGRAETGQEDIRTFRTSSPANSPVEVEL